MDEKTRLNRIVKAIAMALLFTEDYSIRNHNAQVRDITNVVHRIVARGGFDATNDEVKAIVVRVVNNFSD